MSEEGTEEVRKAGSEEFQRDLERAGKNYEARERIANDPELAAERLIGVDRDKYDVSGYSDKEIVMAYQGDDFDQQDYFRLTGKTPSGGGGGGEKPMPETPSAGDDRSVVINESEDSDINVPSPVEGLPDSFLGQYIANSFNAKGGTLTNTGDINATGSVVLDNKVSNQNKVNQIANQSYTADGFRLNMGKLNL